MATYEYVCLACERPFEERRPMDAPAEPTTACPSCGSERVRRRFSFLAAAGLASAEPDGGCACGGTCACRG